MAPFDGKERWLGLDVLRGIAVLLVICRHFENFAHDGSAFYWFLKATSWIGWAGVDLFFALSGFLISNLLFEEYRASGRVRWQRFLIRRAFKIYPGFYLLIIISAIGLVETEGLVSPSSIAGEIFFLQNYLDSLWLHTWSLAVEEHFYIVITLLLVVPWRAHIVKRWPFVVLMVAAFCLAARLRVGMSLPFWYDTHLQQTHVRIDGLFFGSLAGYLFNFHRATLVNLIQRRRGAFNSITAVALIVPFARKLEDSFFERTFGITILAIGCSMLTLAAVTGAFEFPAGRIRNALGMIGRNSYAIYLWHLPIVVRFLPALQDHIPSRIPPPIAFALYVAASLSMGIVMTRWIETPALRLRERWFPKGGVWPKDPPIPALAIAS